MIAVPAILVVALVCGLFFLFGHAIGRAKVINAKKRRIRRILEAEHALPSTIEAVLQELDQS